MFIPYKKNDIKKERFYRLPKEFVKNEFYRDNLNSNMKFLYAILRDRYELSINNGWIDKEGNVYCIYSRENIAEDMNVSVSTVTKSIQHLIKFDLMREVRKGVNKPNYMYISQLNSGLVKNTIQDSLKVLPNDTELKETEKIKRYPIQSNSDSLLSFYNSKFKDKFGKNHPTVRKEQLEDIENKLELLIIEYDMVDEEIKEYIDLHFKKLAEGNDGKIFGFLGSIDGGSSPILRYRDEVEFILDK